MRKKARMQLFPSSRMQLHSQCSWNGSLTTLNSSGGMSSPIQSAPLSVKKSLSVVGCQSKPTVFRMPNAYFQSAEYCRGAVPSRGTCRIEPKTDCPRVLDSQPG